MSKRVQSPVGRLSSEGIRPDHEEVQKRLALVHEGYYEGQCNVCRPGTQETLLVKQHPRRVGARICALCAESLA